MPFAENLRVRREVCGLSLSMLSSLANVSKGYLSQLEHAEALQPSASTVKRLANVLGTTMEWLLDTRAPTDATSDTLPIPPALALLAIDAELALDETLMLACIRWHGKQPRTVDDWRFLYEAIRRSVGDFRDHRQTGAAYGENG